MTEDEEDDESQTRPQLSESQPPTGQAPPPPAPKAEPTQQRTETDR
jgi:hypothetical protein